MEGKLHNISRLKPITNEYTLVIYATIDNTREMLNQSGFNIYKMNIYETQKYMEELNAQRK